MSMEDRLRVIEQANKQAQTTYEDYLKIKAYKDMGYFLQPYVVSGGAVVQDPTYNNRINAVDIVVSLDDNILARDGTTFRTWIPLTTYYLDFHKSGDWRWGTSHPTGTVGEDYLTIATVTTNWIGNVATITDTRGHVGGFLLKDEYGLENYATVAQLADIAKKTVYITPEFFGALGDGVADDTVAMNAAFSFARLSKKPVHLYGSRYKITDALDASAISVHSSSNSVIDIQVSSVVSNAFRWGGNNVTISGITFELSNSTSGVNILGLGNDISNVTNQRFINNKVIGKTFRPDGVTGNIYGLWLTGTGVKDFYIQNNSFETVNYAIQFNQQVQGGSILAPLGNPLENLFIENNSIQGNKIGINTPHVYCKNVFIRGNRVYTLDGFAINLAHVHHFKVSDNIMECQTSTVDVFHIEDICYSGTVHHNKIYGNGASDGIRILNEPGVSQDPYVPTQGIEIFGNEITGNGGNIGISVTSTFSKRIKMSDNIISGYAKGYFIGAELCEIHNPTVKSCALAFDIVQKTTVSGVRIESCTNIIKVFRPIVVDGIMFVDELPALTPVSTSGSVSCAIYHNVDMKYLLTPTSGTPFNLLALPSGKYDFTFHYQFGLGLDNYTARVNVKYDGTTFTATKLYETTYGSIGPATFTVSGGFLRASHSFSGSTAKWFTVNIDTVMYSN
jgi:hypothetical protein